MKKHKRTTIIRRKKTNKRRTTIRRKKTNKRRITQKAGDGYDWCALLKNMPSLILISNYGLRNMQQYWYSTFDEYNNMDINKTLIDKITLLKNDIEKNSNIIQENTDNFCEEKIKNMRKLTGDITILQKLFEYYGVQSINNPDDVAKIIEKFNFDSKTEIPQEVVSEFNHLIALARPLMEEALKEEIEVGVFEKTWNLIIRELLHIYHKNAQGIKGNFVESNDFYGQTSEGKTKIVTDANNFLKIQLNYEEA